VITLLESLKIYLLTGGLVMPVLLFVGILLWTLIGLRIQNITRGFRGDVIERLESRFKNCSMNEKPSGFLDQIIDQTYKAFLSYGKSCISHLEFIQKESEFELNRHRTMIRSLCSVAPLLGLLGTVTGMIETFASMSAMELFAQSGGVAGGISEALITTQLGLFVAIPGLIASRLLDRKSEAIRQEIIRARERIMLLTH